MRAATDLWGLPRGQTPPKKQPLSRVHRPIGGIKSTRLWEEEQEEVGGGEGRGGGDKEEVAENRVSSLAKRAAAASRSSLSPRCEGSSAAAAAPHFLTLPPVSCSEKPRKTRRGKMTRLPHSV